MKLPEIVYRPGPHAPTPPASWPPLSRPAHACAFSGCREPRDRHVGFWPLCRLHADRVEEEARRG